MGYKTSAKEVYRQRLGRHVLALSIMAIVVFNLVPSKWIGLRGQSEARTKRAIKSGTTSVITGVYCTHGATRSNMVQGWPATGSPGNPNWGCVKAADNYVWVKAETKPNDSATWDKIVWNGGSALPGSGNNWRRFPRDNAARFNVKPNINGKGLPQLQIWVMWATVDILTSSSESLPANSVQFAGLPAGITIPGGETLGVVYSSDGKTSNGKICAVATIAPQNVRHVAKIGWNFHRNRWSHDFVDGGHSPKYFDAVWTDDTSEIWAKKLIPDEENKLYDIDAPNAGAFGANDCFETYNDFQQYVVWNLVTASQRVIYPAPARWHYKGKWHSGATPREIISTEVAGGYLDPPARTINTAHGCD